MVNAQTLSTSLAQAGPPPPAPTGVAVMIAAWRASETIGKAVASALAQPEATQIVVVDDASGDNGATVAAARAADDGSGRLIILELPRNGGPARARNAAMAASRSPWLCTLDSDDYMAPGRLAAVLAVAEQGYDLVGDDLLQTPAGLPVSHGRPMWFAAGPAVASTLSFEQFVRANIPKAGRARRELGFLKPLMSRSFLERHRLTYDEAMRLGEDYDLYARALAAGARFRLTPYAGYVSIMRSDSLSARHSLADLASLEAADARLLDNPKLSKREIKLVRAHLRSTCKRSIWIKVTDALKRGRLFTAAGALIREPHHAPHVIGWLFDVALRKATGRKRAS
jgi:succinoglycan biosynthesis protein ExoU